VPKAEVHVLEAGHFALDTAADQIAQLVRDFIKYTNEIQRRETMDDNTLVDSNENESSADQRDLISSRAEVVTTWN